MDGITRLEDDLELLAGWVGDDTIMGGTYPLRQLAQKTAALSVEAQEMLVSIIIEPFGEIVDALGDEMAVDEARASSVAARLPILTH